MAEHEETELVDIGEVEDILEEPAKEEEPPSHGRLQIAALRERFAAFFIDSLILFYCYFGMGQAAYRAFYGKWEGPVPCYGWQGALFHGIFALIVFLYYFIFEGAFTATPGKFLCWLYVRKKTGRYAGMAHAFLRNLFRFVDYALLFIPIFCMELTRAHQRLGDVIAGTTVMKRKLSVKQPYDVNMANIASASGRIASFALDLLICGGLTTGYLLLLSPESPGLSKWLLLFSPLLPLIYFSVTESLTHTSPGKWIFGYAITHEDGMPVSFASSVIRTLFRFFDMTPFGLLALWLSYKHQRSGDLAADTLVSRQNRRVHGGVAFGIWVFVSGLTLWLGLQNRSNFLSDEFKVNFLPTLEIMGNVAEDGAYKTITITDIRFAAGSPGTIRAQNVFKAGEEVFVIFDLHGFERRGRLAWIQQDIEVRYPDGSIGLHQENVVDYHKVTNSTTIELSNSIALPADAMPGVYTAAITVRDLFAHERVSEKETFEVRPEGMPNNVVPTFRSGDGDSPPFERGLSPSPRKEKDSIRSMPAPSF